MSSARAGLPNRRRFLAWGTVSLSLAGSLFGARAVHASAPRALAFESLHTGERLKTVYWVDGAYMPEALSQIDWLLRDHRTNLARPIDPLLLDVLTRLQHQLGVTAPFQVISGYRSPATNRMLAAASTGVARESLHTQGLAIDVRVPGVPLTRLRDTAKSLQAGGVGFYPRSDFVHLDIGRVRYW